MSRKLGVVLDEENVSARRVDIYVDFVHSRSEACEASGMNSMPAPAMVRRRHFPSSNPFDVFMTAVLPASVKSTWAGAAIGLCKKNGEMPYGIGRLKRDRRA